MHCIRLHGLTKELHCTCHKGADCPSPGKHPRDASWQRGQPLDDREIARWTARGGNIGWRMGAQPDGRVLICVDEDEPGAIESASKELGDLPLTLLARTGSGGIHAIFEWPAGVEPPANKVRVLPGIDVRSEGGQIVIEPSRHASGSRYEWIDIREPALIPEAWADALAGRKHQPAAKAPRAWAAWPVDAVASLVHDVYDSGGRHNLSRALGAYLARRGWDDESIAGVVGQLPSDKVEFRVEQALGAAAAARAGDVTIGWGALRERLGDAVAAKLTALARHPSEPADWCLTDACWSEWWARNLPRLERARTPIGPRMIVHHGKAWLRNDDGTYGPQKPIPLSLELKVAIKSHGWDIRDERGKARSVDDIVTDWAEHAVAVEYRFDARGITWDAKRRVIVSGYIPPVIQPLYDDDVAEWFSALFGSNIDAAHRWMAACTQQYSERIMTACLVLVGEKATGKSVLATALSRMWGTRSPVRLADVCARFNGPAVNSPIVLDDECAYLQRGDMTSQEFLERIQARDRMVEHKGLEKVELIGCQRVIVTANDSGSLRFRRIKGRDTAEASADRMSWHAQIDAPRARAALARLRLPGLHDIDIDRVCGHIAWVQANTELINERFVGACGREGALDEIESQVQDEQAPLYDALQRAAAGESWGDAITIADDRIYVHPQSLLSALQVEGHRLDLATLHRWLRNWGLVARPTSRRLKCGPRYVWQIKPFAG